MQIGLFAYVAPSQLNVSAKEPKCPLSAVSSDLGAALQVAAVAAKRWSRWPSGYGSLSGLVRAVVLVPASGSASPEFRATHVLDR
jgi:hypothetical protein